MKIRYNIYLLLGAIAAIIQLVGVPMAIKNPKFSLGSNIAERIGGSIALVLWGILSFLAFRAAYRLNKKMKAKKEQAAIDNFLQDTTGTT